MALIKLLNNKSVKVPHEKAVGIWQLMRGEIEGTPEQQKFCETVANVYLNRYRDDLPASYIRERQRVWLLMDAGKSLSSTLPTNKITEYINNQ